MTEKRFFILKDEQDPTDKNYWCIRDRTFKIKDIYGHYKYDNLEEICRELNALNEENQANDHLLRVYTDFLKEEGYNITDIIDFCQKEISDELTPQLRGDRSILWLKFVENGLQIEYVHE